MSATRTRPGGQAAKAWARVGVAPPLSKLEEWNEFHVCYEESGITIYAACLCFDVEGDLDIDLIDVAEFMVGLSGE